MNKTNTNNYIENEVSKIFENIQRINPNLMDTVRIQQAWYKCVEPAVARHTCAVFVVPNTNCSEVIIYVDNSLWTTELNMRSEVLRIDLNVKLKELEIDFINQNSEGTEQSSKRNQIQNENEGAEQGTEQGAEQGTEQDTNQNQHENQPQSQSQPQNQNTMFQIENIEVVKKLIFKTSKDEYKKKNRLYYQNKNKESVLLEQKEEKIQPIPLTDEEKLYIKEKLKNVEDEALKQAMFNAMRAQIELEKAKNLNKNN